MNPMELKKEVVDMVSQGAPAEDILEAHQTFVDTEVAYLGIYQESTLKRYLYQLLGSGVQHNHVNLVTKMVENHCPLNLTNVYDSLLSRGHTVSFPRHLPQPLIEAVERRDRMMVDLLLRHGADIHEEHIRMTGDVLTAVDVACEKDDMDILNILRPYFKQSRYRHHKNLLHIACKRKGYKCAETLLAEGEINVNEIDTQGYTPLMYCVRHGSQYVSLLLQTNVDVNTLSHEGTALHLLVFPYIEPNLVDVNLNEFLASLELLLERGADVSLMSGNGNTPLSWILSRAGVYPLSGHLDHSLDGEEYSSVTMKAFEMILEASPTGINSVNNWLSMSTVMKNLSELFTYLRNRFQDNFERNAVGSAKMNHELLRRLLEFGLDPNTPANCLTHIRVGLQDLTLLEAILAELCILAGNTTGLHVLKGTVFNKVGQVLVTIFQDFLNYGGRLRTDMLYKALIKNHPCIWPFVQLYLLRCSHRNYQAILNDMMSRLLLARRISERTKTTLRELVPRVNSLKQLSRLAVHEAMGREVCPHRISTLSLPPAMQQYIAFQIDLPSAKETEPGQSTSSS